MEMMLKDKKSAQLQKALDEASVETTQLKIDLIAYEKQASNLSRALATSDRQVRHLEVSGSITQFRLKKPESFAK